MTKHYLNLTNGLEWLPDVQVLNQPYSFVRIQSTTLECKNYIKLIGDLDHDFLLHLAIGTKVFLYDCGTNRAYSKTIYSGVPIIRYILNRFWFGTIPDKVYRLCRNGSQGSEESIYFDSVYRNLFEFDQNREKSSVKTKLNYYKRYLNCAEIDLVGVSCSTKNDGNYPFYRELLLNNTK